MKRVFVSVLALLLLLPLGPMVHALAGPCGLCIVEIQTSGLGGSSEEYVVIANNTSAAYDMTSHSLRYKTAAGSTGGTITLMGSLAAHATKTFISSNLATLAAANPAVPTFSFGIADTGGTWQLLKTGLVTPIDQVGWGTASLRETGATIAHERGWSLTRTISAAVYQDTNDNTADFAAVPHACLGLSINEIQPQLVDPDGYDLDQALEILKTTDAVTDQDCPVKINTTNLYIGAAGLGAGAGLSSIYKLQDNLGNSIPIGLVSDTANNLQFMPRSSYGGVVIAGGLLTQPILLTGQTYARFSTGFKATYQPTIGAANVLRTTPLAPVEPAPTAVPDDCSDIFVNELLPNPTGDDTGNEWAEFVTDADHTVSLRGCVLRVNGTQYHFGADQFIAPDQYLVLGSFSDGTSSQTLALRNSGVNSVSFGHSSTDGAFAPLQTVEYSDAPEGQSWARFDDGWRWVGPTKGAENDVVLSGVPDDTPQPTEFAAPTETIDPAAPSAGTDAPPTLLTFASLTITELLPNPAAPATDDQDEYIEIYNPTDQIVNLSGYRAQTGSNYSYSYTFDSGTLLPHQYAAFYSKSTNLVLSNTAGGARLLDPAGQVIDQTDSYSDAKDGQAWALIADTWQWTSTPTPRAENVATIPLLSTIKTTTPKSTTAQKTTAPKNNSSAVKSTKANKAPKAASAQRQVYKNPAAVPPSIHPSILAGVGLMALLYAAYEYRLDAVNRLHQLRRYRSVRRAARAKA